MTAMAITEEFWVSRTRVYFQMRPKVIGYEYRVRGVLIATKLDGGEVRIYRTQTETAAMLGVPPERLNGAYATVAGA